MFHKGFSLLVLKLIRNANKGDANEGGIGKFFTQGQFIFIKSTVVASHHIGPAIMLGGARLDKNMPFFFPSAGAPGRLGDKLECPLRGAVVRKIKTKVGVNNNSQRHIRKMVPL